MSQSECPSREQLVAFAQCALDDIAADEVNQHLTMCGSCDDTVTSLQPRPNPVWSLVENVDDSVAATDTGLQQFMQRMDSFVRGGMERTVMLSDPEHPPTIRDYRLIGPLGRGGMGTVFKAEHVHLQKTFALKLVSPEHFRSQDVLERFKREMIASGQLQHPNIVTATDAGVADGHHFLVMDFVDGETLAAVARRRGTLPIAEACELIRQAADGLQYAHENGLVHRDIKPSNLMLSRDGTLKILDLGLALLRDRPVSDATELTSAGQMMGTVDYMAPEQGHDTHGVDIRADIYSLGATFYKLLTGRVVFDQPEYDTPLSKLAALNSEQPRPVTESRADVPAELAAVLQRMLAKNPDDRFATPAEVAAALEPFTADAQTARLLDHGESTHQPDAVATEPATKPTMKAGTESVRGPRRFVRTIVAAAVLLPLIYFSPLIVRFATDQGVVVVESDAADIEVVIKDGKGEIIDRKAGRRFWLTAGEYGLEVAVRDGNGELKFVTRELTLKRGGEQTIRAYIEQARPREQIAAKDGQGKADAPHGDGTAAATAVPPMSDEEVRKRLAGLDWQPGPHAVNLPGLATHSASMAPDLTWNLRAVAPESPHSAWYSPRAGYVVYREEADDPLVFLMELDTGRIIAALALPPAVRIGWHPDELEFFTQEIEDGIVTRFRLDGVPVARWKSAVGDANTNPAWSPDGNRIALPARGVIEVRTPSGNLIRSFPHEPHPQKILWASNSRRFVAAFKPNELGVFDLERDEPVRITEDEPILRSVWHPDGTGLHVSTNSYERFWSMVSPPKPGEKRPRNRPMAFSPDGQYVVTASGNIEKTDGTHVAKLPLKTDDGTSGRQLRRFTWVEDERIRAVYPQLPGTFTDYSPTGRVLREQSRPLTVSTGTLAWLDEDRFATVGLMPFSSDSYGAARYFQWSLSGRGDQSAVLDSDGATPNSRLASFHSATGRFVVQESHPEARSRLAVFGQDGKRESSILTQPSPAEIMAWSPGGELLATATWPDGDRKLSINIWAGNEPRSQGTADAAGVAGILWSPDGEYLAVWDAAGNLFVWDSDDLKKPIAKSKTSPLHYGLFYADVSTPTWSPDSQRLAFFDAESLRILAVNDGSVSTLTWKEKPRGSVWWLPDGESFLIADSVYSLDGTVQRTLPDVPRGGFTAVQWLRDGPGLIGRRGRILQVRQTSDAEPDTVLLPGCQVRIGQNDRAARGIGHHPFGPDGRHLAAVVPRHNYGTWGVVLGDVGAVDVQTKRLLWTGVGYSDGTQIKIADTGRIVSPPDDVDRYLTYLVRYSSGRTVALTQRQFASRIGLSDGQRTLQAILDHGGRVQVSDNADWFTAGSYADASQLPKADRVVSIDLSDSLIVTGELVAGFRHFSALQRLDLGNASIGDAALSWLHEATALKSLNLSGTAITDQLGNRLPKQLEELDVSGTRVGDLMTIELRSLKSLRRVVLSDTGATESAVTALHQALPDCEVVRKR